MFVHLRCHSHYSFLRGVNPPEEIIAAAAQKMPAVALTDTNGMYAAVPFYQAARAAGVKPIVGVVLEVEREVKEIKEVKEVKEKERKNGSANAAMVLLAMDAEGYSNLCRLTTLRQLGILRPGQETFAEEAGRAVTVEELAAHSAGVIALWPAGEFLRGGVAQEGRVNSRQSTVTNHQSPSADEGNFWRAVVYRGAAFVGGGWAGVAGGAEAGAGVGDSAGGDEQCALS